MSASFIESLEIRQCLSGGAAAVAAQANNGAANGTALHIQDKKQLKDGSCQTTVVADKSAATAVAAPTATADKIQLRKRDGTCVA